MKIFEIVNKGKGLIEDLTPENLLLIEESLSGSESFLQKIGENGSLENSNVYESDYEVVVNDTLRVGEYLHVDSLKQNDDYNTTLKYSNSLTRSASFLQYVNDSMYFTNYDTPPPVSGSSGSTGYGIAKVDLSGNVIEVVPSSLGANNKVIVKMVKVGGTLYYVVNDLGFATSVVYSINTDGDTSTLITSLPKKVYDFAVSESTGTIFLSIDNGTLGDVYKVVGDGYEIINIGFDVRGVASDYNYFYLAGRTNGDTYKIDEDGTIVETLSMFNSDNSNRGGYLAIDTGNNFFYTHTDTHLELVNIGSGTNYEYYGAEFSGITYIQLLDGNLYITVNDKILLVNFSDDSSTAYTTVVLNSGGNKGIAVNEDGVLMLGRYDQIYTASPAPKRLLTTDGDGMVVPYDGEVATKQDILDTIYIEVTKNELGSLIKGQNLVPGALYKITGVQPELYDDGTNSGTTVYLHALTSSTIAENGHGEFYNPSYNNATEGFDIWDNINTWSLKPHQGLDSSYFSYAWDEPIGVVVSGTDQVYVICTNNRVYSIDATGSTYSSYTVGDQPSGIAVDTNTNLVYISNYGDNSVTRISAGTSGGEFVELFGSGGSGPSSVYVDFAGNVYTTNELSNDVTKYTISGTASTFTNTGAEPCDMIGNGSYLYIVNGGDDTVSRVSYSGGTSSVYATVGPDPRDICMDLSDNLYVTNTGDNTISKIDSTSGVSTVFATVSGVPSDIIFQNDTLFVTISDSNTIEQIDMDGNVSLYTTVGPSPSSLFRTGGRMFVTCKDEDSVYKVENVISEQDFDANEFITSDNGATGRLVGSIETGRFEALSGSWSESTYFTGDSSNAAMDIVEIDDHFYEEGDRVIWGGYYWENISSKIGFANSSLELSSDDWEKVKYSSGIYTKVVDIIEYDFFRDWISRRYETTSGCDIRCSQNEFQVIEDRIDEGSSIGFPISVFQFGNPSVVTGITVDGGFFDNINFCGYNQNNISLKKGAYQYKTKYYKTCSQKNLSFDLNAYQSDITFNANAYQMKIVLGVEARQSNISFDDQAYQANISLIGASSFQNGISFKNSAYQENLTFGNLASQYNITMGDGSVQQNIDFGTGSSQYNLDLGGYSHQDFLTFDCGSFQSDLILGESSYQSYLQFGVQSAQETIEMEVGCFQKNLTFGTSARQSQITLRENSFQSFIDFHSGAFQQAVHLDYNTNQQNIVFMTNSGLRYLNISNYSMNAITFEALTPIEYANFDTTTIMGTNYPKTIYRKPDGSFKIRYYNNSDTLVIADLDD